MREDNFLFNGRHCLRDFGCLYKEQTSGHIVLPKATYSEYTIAGVSGTVDMGLPPLYAPMEYKGALYPLTPMHSRTERQHLARQITAWLSCGRQRLIFDYEPDKYYLADVRREVSLGYDKWLDGGLPLTMTLQPFAYNLSEDSVTRTMDDTPATLRLSPATGLPAPVSVTVTNTGTAPLQGVTVTLGDKTIALVGMSMTQNRVLHIHMDAPILATIGQKAGEGENALPYVQRLDTLTLRSPQDITVRLAFGAGTPQATVRLACRGRWI